MVKQMHNAMAPQPTCSTQTNHFTDYFSQLNASCEQAIALLQRIPLDAETKSGLLDIWTGVHAALRQAQSEPAELETAAVDHLRSILHPATLNLHVKSSKATLTALATGRRYITRWQQIWSFLLDH